MHVMKWVVFSVMVASVPAFSAEIQSAAAPLSSATNAIDAPRDQSRSVVALQSVSVMNDGALDSVFELEAPIPALPLSLGLVLPMSRAAPEASLGLEDLLVKLQVDGLAAGAFALKPTLGVWFPTGNAEQGLTSGQHAFEPSLKAQADLMEGVATELVALANIPMTEGAATYGTEAALALDVASSGLTLENRLLLALASDGAWEEAFWRPQLSYSIVLSPRVTLTPAMAALVGLGPTASQRGFYGALGFQGAFY